ncbi:MAG: metallophosphoesterase [bacterium]|nr:metallophosphoesterase [bacterium]
MRVTHDWTESTATIRVEGLSETVRMLHVTDSHFALLDERDAEHAEASASYCERFTSNELIFSERMQEARTLGVDLVALTGDIIHFPARASVEYVADAIAQIDAPVLFTCGNHDWHFPGLQGREELRETWWPVLDPLHKGKAACAAHEVGGVQFLLVDDSTYQINSEQLAFVKGRLALGKPTVLLTHIPLSLPTLRAPVLERWKAPIMIGDPDWDLESREKWQTGEDLSSTLEYVQALSRAENLVAVFCGHVHFHHVDAVNSGAVQYVGAPGFEGGKRMVEFRPL